jgi:hypothetical protein
LEACAGTGEDPAERHATRRFDMTDGRRTRNRIMIVVAAVVMLVGGAYAAFTLIAGGGGPPPVSLSTTGGASPTVVGSPGGGATSADDLVGTWKVTSDGSVVGYRVREKLGFLPAPSDAVGRTSASTAPSRSTGRASPR